MHHDIGAQCSEPGRDSRADPRTRTDDQASFALKVRTHALFLPVPNWTANSPLKVMLSSCYAQKHIQHNSGLLHIYLIMHNYFDDPD
jgi:hypothetical protein